MDAPRDFDAAVLIVGAGPVGLVAAMDLSRRGIASIVVETRHVGEPPPVKCNHVAARSMEIFRRLGVARAVRAAGLPGDYPSDVVFLTTSTGQEIGRIPIPSRAERALPPSDYFPDSGWPTVEPPHRINQIYLEPVLFEHARKQPGVTILNRARLERFAQDADGVSGEVVGLDDGVRRTIRARYMIAADGGRSGVRKQLGIRLTGNAEISRYLSTHIRAPSLLGLMGGRRPGWMNHAVNPRRTGNAVAIDGKVEWLVHAHLKGDEKDFDAIDRDRAIRDVLGVDDDFEYEVLGKEDWIARRLVAERFREGRVFLAGDAAHIWIPVAGYGMNAGIADVTNLTFMLAARLNGWGSQDMLDAYELERHPITDQLSRFVGGLGQKLAKDRAGYGPELAAQGPEGDAARAALGRYLVEQNTPQYCCEGLNFAYFYDNSPLVTYDGEAAPAYSLGSYTPSSVPGARLPFFRMEDGNPVHDRLGDDYTLLRFDPSLDVSALLAGAAQAGVPVQLLDVDRVLAPDTIRHGLLVVRSDQQIAWRGDALPVDPAGLVAKLAGFDANAFARHRAAHRAALLDKAG
ncbi:MAG: FAD-dependent monooxygenase [Rhizobiaceae bacterium]|nr:FAD-dependent monooxygenase [Rhizobiaceae bacterium]